jgi:5-methylcytosine-specific restriction endonuclease McrA
MSYERSTAMAGYWKGKKLSEETKHKLSEVRKGRQVSEETKRKISLGAKGKNTWSKGRKLSEETRRKMSESRKGMIFTEERRQNISKGNQGRVFSEEHRRNIGLAGKGRTPWNKGLKFGSKSEEERRKHSEAAKGEKHYNWQGGKTAEAMRVRRSLETRLWREAVFSRDDYTCQECGIRSKSGVRVYLHAHHIKPFADYPELRFDVSNGVTLCKDCHEKTPKYRGRRHKE